MTQAMKGVRPKAVSPEKKSLILGVLFAGVGEE